MPVLSDEVDNMQEINFLAKYQSHTVHIWHLNSLEIIVVFSLM